MRRLLPIVCALLVAGCADSRGAREASEAIKFETFETLASPIPEVLAVTDRDELRVRGKVFGVYPGLYRDIGGIEIGREATK